MIAVEAPGLLTSLQDLGRQGYQHLGLGPGGAMDTFSLRVANRLAGNAEDEAALEITLHGPRLRFEADTRVALCGGDLSPELDGVAFPMWRPVHVRAGTVLTFGKPRHGARAYLAVAGGFETPVLLGGRGTNLRGGFGGFQGRALKTGDRLESRGGPGVARRRAWQPGASCAAPTWHVDPAPELDLHRPAVGRVIPGPQWGALTEASKAAFLGGEYSVGNDSDRMGLRLKGPQLTLQAPLELLSSAVAFGTLQLPPEGAPILLMADHQTTGGYPRLGEIASVDLPRLAQLRPGEAVAFALITVAEAQVAFLARERRLGMLATIPAWDSSI